MGLSPRSADLWSGAGCLGLGALALWAGADYPLGTAGRIGPGYVPRLLGWLLVGIAVILFARSLFRSEDVELGFAWRPVVLVLGSVLAFAGVLSQFGLVPAILATVAIANYAVAENTWRSAVSLGVGLALFAWVLFVKALGLPIPVLVLSQ